MRRTFLLAAAMTLVSSAHALDFYLAKTVNLGPSGLDVFGGTSGNNGGFNPSAFDTDGTNLWVGGYATNAIGSTGIVRILNAFGATPTVQLMANTVKSTPQGRGITGVAVDTDSGGFVYLAWDQGSTANVESTRAYGAFDGSFKWNGPSRAHQGGIAIDPNFGGTGKIGVSAPIIGSGRRLLYDLNTGAEIYGPSGSPVPGFIMIPTSGAPTPSSQMRGITFSNTGECYTRAANNVYKAGRTGTNSSTGPNYLFTPASPNDGVNVAGQYIEHINVGSGYVIFNNRPNSLTASFATVMQVRDANTGAAVTTNFLNGSGSGSATIADGNGWYDMKFVGGNLYVLDFFNRNVYVFSQSPVTTVLAPQSLAITSGFGTLLGGNLTSLINSDDNKLVVLNDEFATDAEIDLTFNAPAGTYSSITTKVEVSASRPNLVLLVQLFDNVDNDFEIIGGVDPIPDTDAVSNLPWTVDVPNYIAANGTIKVRLRSVPSESYLDAPDWVTFIDQVQLTLE